MDPDSQPDKPPQGDFQEFTNVLGTFIALVTLVTPLAAIVLFSPPLTGSADSLTYSSSESSRLSLSHPRIE